MKPSEFDRNEITLAPGELAEHVQRLLDDAHRDLALLRTMLIAACYAVLGVVNFLTFPDQVRFAATGLALLVVVSFALFSIVHRYIAYPPAKTNLVTFAELCILQLDALAFGFVSDNAMGGFGVYLMIIGAGIFMTSARWVVVSGIMLFGSWMLASLFWGTSIQVEREVVMMVATICGAYFFFKMRVRSAQKLAEHQLKEQKYKETLEHATERIATLSGLLPICASCKSIRTEDDEWTDLDIYLRDRSDVEFTHSVCPSCQKMLYPEYQGRI